MQEGWCSFNERIVEIHSFVIPLSNLKYRGHLRAADSLAASAEIPAFTHSPKVNYCI
jgi:hypothetical protein